MIWFDTKLNEWVSDTQDPVCQDHAAAEPCPYERAAASTC